MIDNAPQSLESRLTATFETAGCFGSLHVRDIDSGASVALHPHQLAVAASVFKVAVALELHRQASVGVLDLSEQIRLDETNRTPGPTGLSNAQDPAALSLRDLAMLMLSISDNTATDVIIERVGLANINATLQALGLRDTFIESNLRDLIHSIVRDAGVPNLTALWSLPEATRDERLENCRALRPEHATRTTAYDMTSLLCKIWRDEAAPPEVCEQVRLLLGQQPSYRIGVGFPGGISVSAKSGSLMGRIRNEIGVVCYPDGRRYAVAVFTSTHKREARQPEVDRAIGAVSALAVEHLRTTGPMP